MPRRTRRSRAGSRKRKRGKSVVDGRPAKPSPNDRRGRASKVCARMRHRRAQNARSPKGLRARTAAMVAATLPTGEPTLALLPSETGALELPRSDPLHIADMQRRHVRARLHGRRLHAHGPDPRDLRGPPRRQRESRGGAARARARRRRGSRPAGGAAARGMSRAASRGASAGIPIFPLHSRSQRVQGEPQIV